MVQGYTAMAENKGTEISFSFTQNDQILNLSIIPSLWREAEDSLVQEAVSEMAEDRTNLFLISPN